MKSVISIVAVFAMALVLSTVAFAKNKDSGKFELTKPATIGTTQLQAGHYKADWMRMSGNEVEVDIQRNGKTVVSTDAKIKELPKASNQTAVVLDTASSNKRVVEIDFNGNREALIFGS